MKRPYPTRRTDTITRANVLDTLAEFPKLSNPQQVATTIMGTVTVHTEGGTREVSRATNRHVERCRRLMAKSHAEAT